MASHLAIMWQVNELLLMLLSGVLAPFRNEICNLHPKKHYMTPSNDYVSELMLIDVTSQ